MTKNHVIKKNHEFQKIIKKRKQKVSKYLVAYVVENNTELRVGISISKKTANAVYRNRYRRQVRSILDQINVRNLKKDIVLILRKEFID